MRNYKRKRQVRWGDLSAWQRAGMAVLGAVEVILAGAAWADLIRRPSSQVRGPKWRWALVIGVNIFGPLSYFRWGRIQPEGPGALTASPDSSGDIDITDSGGATDSGDATGRPPGDTAPAVAGE